MMNKHTDESIERVREARRKISEQYGHDPKRIVEHYIELQKQYQDRLLAMKGKGKNQNAT